MVERGNQLVAAELVVEDGQVVQVVPAGMETAVGDEKWVDLGGCVVVPGVVDAGIRISRPDRETVATATAAAAAGGVTTAIVLPDREATEDPLEEVAGILRDAAGSAMVDLAIVGRAPDPADEGTLTDLVEAGVVGLEVAVDDATDRLVKSLQQAARAGLVAMSRPNPTDLIGDLDRRLGRDRPQRVLAWAANRPASLEAAAVSRLVEGCRSTAARVHVHGVSAAESLDVASAARFEGLPFSVGTCPHYLLLTLDDLAARGAELLTDPVLRSEADRDRMWQGLASGEIDVVASDHDPPAWAEERTGSDPWRLRPGLPGVEQLLPLLISEGYHGSAADLESIVRTTSRHPAVVFGLHQRKGRLAPGLDADFVALELEEPWQLRAADTHTLHRVHPLDGRELTGRVRATYLRGQCVYRRDADGGETFAEPAAGRVVAGVRSGSSG